MKKISRKLLVLLLVLSLSFSVSIPAYADDDDNDGGGGGWGPAKVLDGIGDLGDFAGTIGSVVNLGTALVTADWSDPGGACLGLIDTIFGTSFTGDPMQEALDAIYSDVSEIKETTNYIKDSVDYLTANSVFVNRKLNSIDGTLKTVNSRLILHTQMLSQITDSIETMNQEMTASFTNLTNLVDDRTKIIEAAVYDTTVQIQKTDQLNNLLTNYINKYSDLYSVEKNIMKSLKTKQSDYTTFIEAIKDLDNGTEIIEALSKVNFEGDGLSLLSERQKSLLTDTTVKVGSKSYQVLKYHQDFVDDLMTFIAGTGEKTSSVYFLNGSIDGKIGDLVLTMGDYLTADNQYFNSIGKGIGEIYYIYNMYTMSNSVEVHAAYREFMDNMVLQYMTAAWLAEMAYGYRITSETIGSNDSNKITEYEQYLYDIKAQMTKVLAYYDYEYKKCIDNYDFGSYKVDIKDKYMTFYGNAVNGDVWNLIGKNKVYDPAGLSESDVVIALGEDHQLYYFYRYADVSKREKTVWTSDNPDVVAVDSDGTLLAVSRGTATISVTYNGDESRKASCTVSVGDVMAIGNKTETSNFHYYTYERESGEWVTKDTCYSLATEKGYDYYYGVNTYTTNAINLTEDTRSANIAEATGMSDANMDAFSWVTTGDGAIQLDGYEVAGTVEGWTEVIGYKLNMATHTYDYIGIPVHSTIETVFEEDSVDYSTYKQISTKEDLIKLANKEEGWGWGLNDKYVLTADIDLGGMEWTPIGYSYGFGSFTDNTGYYQTTIGLNYKVSDWGVYEPFKGIFDGNGHTISNFKVTQIHHADEITAKYNELRSGSGSKGVNKELTLACQGLFGYLKDAQVTNLNVTEGYIGHDTSNSTGLTLEGETVTYSDDMTFFAGILAGASETDPAGRSGAEATEEEQQELIDAMSGSDEDFEAYINKKEAEMDPPPQLAKLKEYFIDNNDNRKYALMYYAMALGNWHSLDFVKNNELIVIDGCYVSGAIDIDIKDMFYSSGTASKGTRVFAGMLAGGTDADLHNCTAIETTNPGINTHSKSGAVGGLIGVLMAHSGQEISDCSTTVNINSEGGENAGGLIGKIFGLECTDLNEVEYKDDDTAEELNNKFSESVLNFPPYGYYDLNDPNVKIRSNAINADISSQGGTGGVVGLIYGQNASNSFTIKRVTPKNADELTPIKYNVDIEENYVAGNITSTYMDDDEDSLVPYSGGIVGYTYLYPEEADLLDGGYAEIKNNYYYGNISSECNAGGVLGYTRTDYGKISGNIIAAKSIKGSKYGYAATGLENGYTLESKQAGSLTVKGALVYSGASFSGTNVNDGATLANADTFDTAATYQNLWSENGCFLTLTGMDIVNGNMPTRMISKYKFPLDTAVTAYYEGDSFKPVKNVIYFSGNGTENITVGVTSTSPDMNKVGVQEVTVSYRDYSETYKVYIYPKAGYLKSETKPTVEKTGASISGGKYTFYENGQAKATVSLSNCTVSKNDNDVFIIRYGKYTTALRPVRIDVFANSLETPQAEYIGTEYYTEGQNADVSGTVPQERTYNNKTYKLQGTSQSTSFNASNDAFILCFHADGSNSGGNSGSGSSGDSGSGTSGDSGSGTGTGTGGNDNPNAVSITNASVDSIAARTYSGKVQEPAVTVTYNGKTLTAGTDYIVSYSDNVNAGTAKVLITGINGFNGSTEKTFTIKAKKITPKVTLSTKSFVYNGKARKPKVTVKNGTTKIASSNYTVKYASGRKNVGKYSVKVTMKNNYSGTKTVYFSVIPKATTLSKATGVKKGVTVKWKAMKTKMSKKRITGYQVQVATNKAFTKNVKQKLVKGYKKTSVKMTGLKAKKKYFVRVRTYCSISGKVYYSKWSKAKSTKTK